jgi:NADPH:quinone reductase-like Zn-dependent oxidoreductase
MKAAIVTEAGRPPIYGEFRDPVPADGEKLIRVTASALNNLAKSRAAGVHYSSSSPSVPFVVGVDGVGRLDDGRRVYFVFPTAPFGSMSERTVARTSACLPLPADLDDVTAAAVAVPGMSSWAALTERVRLQRGESVLVNGATGVSGRLAVQIAKHLGARRVVATARNEEALRDVPALGADATIPLRDVGDGFEEAVQKQFAGEGIDVVLDYLWGPSAERILAAAAKRDRSAVPVRFVQIGALSAPSISLPGAALRASAIELLGSGVGSLAPEAALRSIGAVLNAAVPGQFRVATRPVPLSDVESTWSTAEAQPRVVFQIP